MSDDRGQALVVAALGLAIAAVVVAGLRATHERVAAEARVRRAGEAAVQAATAVIADAYISELTRQSAPKRADIVRAIEDGRARDEAGAAAVAMSVVNGSDAPLEGPTVTCARGLVDVAIVLAGRTYRAGFDAPECSLP